MPGGATLKVQQYMNVASKQQVAAAAAAQVVFFGVRSRIFTFPAGGGQGLSTWGHTFQTLDYSLSNATKLFNVQKIFNAPSPN